MLNFEHTPMFFESSYVNEQNGQKYPEYLMNRDGFSLLVMGFTGQKALEWKLKYIKAFNEMEKQLREQKTKMLTTTQMFSLQAKINEEHEQKLLEQQNQLDNHEQRLEEIEHKVRKKEYPYPDKKLRNQIRGAIWNLCSDVFSEMSDEERKEYPSVKSLIPVFYEKILIPEFERQLGINLTDELALAQEYWREKYIREKVSLKGKAPNKNVLRPSEIEELTIQSLIATNPKLGDVLLNIISAFKE